MTTKQAFTELISQHGWGKSCGLTGTQATSTKHLFLKGKLSLNKQFFLLKKARYSVNINWAFSEKTKSKQARPEQLAA